MFEIINDPKEIENSHSKFLAKLESNEYEVIPVSLDSGRGDWEENAKYIKSGNFWFTHSIGENDTLDGLFFNNFGLNRPSGNNMKSSERCQIAFSLNNKTAAAFAINTKTNKIALVHDGRLANIKKEYFFNSFDRGIISVTNKKKGKRYAIIGYLDSENKEFVSNLSAFIKKVFTIKDIARKERLGRV